MATTSAAVVPILSASTALLAAGGIAAISLFDVPELQSQPASRSLPMTRWLFSRGSHIFPTAALASSAGFVASAYRALLPAEPLSRHGLVRLARLSGNGAAADGLLLAAGLAFSIVPFTLVAMLPTNFALIRMNEGLGGYRSARTAREAASRPGQRSALDSVVGKGEGSEFTDLSGPQEVTPRESSAQEDVMARELLGRFGLLNLVRAVLIGTGGVVGLFAAVAK